jgi:hypothetical protein
MRREEEIRADYLEKLYEAKELVNELTGTALEDCGFPEYADESVSRIYHLLDGLLSPECPDCEITARRFVTSPAQLYDSAMAELPGGTISYWTGDWYCPKCRHIVAHGMKWWVLNDKGEK